MGSSSINPDFNRQVSVPLGHIRGLEQLTTIYVVISVEDMTRPKRVLVVNSAGNSWDLSQHPLKEAGEL